MHLDLLQLKAEVTPLPSEASKPQIIREEGRLTVNTFARSEMDRLAGTKSHLPPQRWYIEISDYPTRARGGLKFDPVAQTYFVDPFLPHGNYVPAKQINVYRMGSHFVFGSPDSEQIDCPNWFVSVGEPRATSDVSSDAIEKLYELGPAMPTSSALAEIIVILDRLIAEEQFEQLDMIFKNVDLKRISLAAIVALLRLTYLYQSRIAGWRELLKKARTEIKSRGKSPARMLQGLA